MKFNPSTLFERGRARRPVAYQSQKAELDAVQTQKKALLHTEYRMSYIADGGAHFIDLMKEAFARGLAVTLQNRLASMPFDRQVAEAYVLPLEQTWRISALNALQDSHIDGERLAFAYDAQLSLLRGYTSKQRASWLAYDRRRHVAYGCLTMYTLLTREQRDLVVSLGKRCFGPASAIEGMRFFFRGDHAPLVQNAVKLVPTGLTIARVGFDWRHVEGLFGPWKKMKPRGVNAANVSGAFAQSAIEALRTNVQFMSASGWK